MSSLPSQKNRKPIHSNSAGLMSRIDKKARISVALPVIIALLQWEHVNPQEQNQPREVDS